ncbi:S-layer homology domain-containing protein [Paenibacillus sp. YN15]|uniref:S-layer homology domain-containing protein n=1 Tax=Paenibacillus sp. YN15 TaxID=1742774 RepID=UPI000DCC9F07|nr:S-layer homology domain-containing protein [Paenibacillus sp. YN15]RAV01707.1 hypothetical protein DQG13_11380 [Paenibacillus sp. YN15]
MRRQAIALLSSVALLFSGLPGLPGGVRNAEAAALETPQVIVTPPLQEVLGSTHTSGRYYFGEEDFLNEGAERMLSLGSSSIKVWLSAKPQESYPYNSEWPANIGQPDGPQSLLEILMLPHYQELLEKDFQVFVFEAIEFGPLRSGGGAELTTIWKDGLSPAEKERVEEQFYELTRYLLTRFAHTGKTFLLQNWEGDNALRAWETPPAQLPTAIQGMIDWSNARQDGINRARLEAGDIGVTVAGALEVTRIPAGGEVFDHKLVVDEVVPHTHMDLYSLSTWGTRLPGEEQELLAKLAYYKDKAPDSALYGADNLMLGEFGAYETTYNKPESFPQNNYEATLSPGRDNEFNETTGRAQLVANRKQLEYALQMGVRFALYWELYDNGLKDGITLDSLTPDERGYKVARMEQLRGVWLVRQDGSYTPTWHYFANLYNPKTVTDYLNDWSRTYSRTSNLEFVREGAASRAEGDTSRAVNSSGADGSLVYRLAKPISSFSAKLFHTDGLAGKLEFYASADGTDWTAVETAVTPGAAGQPGSWQSAFAGSSALPPDSIYLRAVLKGNTAGSLELSGIQINSEEGLADPHSVYYNPAELTGLLLDGKPLQAWNSLMLVKYPYDDSLPQVPQAFDPAVAGYKVFLPVDAAESPVIEGIVNDPRLQVEVTQADSIPGTAQIRVSSPDGSSQASYRVEFARELTAALTPEAAVGTGKELALDYSLRHVARGIQAQDIVLGFDPQMLEWKDAAALNSVTRITYAGQESPGRVRIMAAALGADSAIDRDGPLLRFTFLAKAPGQTAVTLEQTAAAEANGMEWIPGRQHSAVTVGEASGGESGGSGDSGSGPSGGGNGAAAGQAAARIVPGRIEKSPELSPGRENRLEALVRVTAEELRQALGEDGSQVDIPVSAPEGRTLTQAAVELPLSALAELSSRSLPVRLTVSSPLGAYTVPLGTLPKLPETPGQAATLRLIIASAAGSKAEETLRAQFALASPVTEFRAAVSTAEGERSLELPVGSHGSSSASRTLPVTLPGFTPELAAGVKVEADGSIRYMPAYFHREGTVWSGELFEAGSGFYAVAVSSGQPFADTVSHWGNQDIAMLAARGIVRGQAEGSYGPDLSLTRAELAAMLVRGLGLKEELRSAAGFTDVPGEGWQAGAVGAALAAGLIHGNGDGSFRPDAPVTREELAVMMDNALAWAGVTVPADSSEAALARFEDRGLLSDWAAEAIARTAAAGIVEGRTDSLLAAKGEATRAEAAVMVKRLLVKARFMNP